MRWSDSQVTIGTDGMPLPRDSRALRAEDGGSVSPRKRDHPQHEGGGGGSREGGTSRDGPERGGAAAASSYSKAAKKANWEGILERAHSVGQCGECEAASNRVAGGRCEAHAPPPSSGDSGPPSVWWQQPQADPGAIVRRAEALARAEKSYEEPDSSWRREWVDVRREQLRLQGEAHGATSERVEPGGPESVEWTQTLFEHQIGILVREALFAKEHAIGYTLLACGGVSALARAARDAGGGGGGAPGGDFALSRRLVANVLCTRTSMLTAAAPTVYANLGGPMGLVRSDVCWAQLTPDAAIGLQFTTSALVRAPPMPWLVAISPIISPHQARCMHHISHHPRSSPRPFCAPTSARAHRSPPSTG